MKFMLVLIFFCLLTACHPSITPPPPSLTTQPATQTATSPATQPMIKKTDLFIYFIGDSHTIKGSYVAAVMDVFYETGQYDVSIDMTAKGGATPKQLEKHLNKKHDALNQIKADQKIALLMAGTNAYDHATVIQMAIKLHKAGFEVVIIETPPRLNPGNKRYGFPHANATFNSKLRKAHAALPEEMDITLLKPPADLYDPEKVDVPGDWLNPKYAADHTHLTREGYALLGHEIATMVLNPTTTQPAP